MKCRKWSPRYEVTAAVTTALDRYPKIKAMAPIGPSRHIVRLLALDVAGSAARADLELIERYADVAPEMVQELLRASFRLEFMARLTEVHAFHYFTQYAGLPTAAIARVRDQKTPDFEVTWSGGAALVEVYSPNLYQNFAVLLDDVGVLFGQRFDGGPDGVAVNVGPPRVPGTAPSGGWPAALPDERDILRMWMAKLAYRVDRWMNAADGSTLTCPGPVGSGVEVTASLTPAEPGVAKSWSHGTDLFSDIRYSEGDPAGLASSLIGWQIKRKLDERQAGAPDPSKLRALVVDLSHTGISEPDYILTRECSARLAAAAAHMVDAAAPQYDVLLPAVLHEQPEVLAYDITLNPDRAPDVERFASEAVRVAPDDFWSPEPTHTPEDLDWSWPP